MPKPLSRDDEGIGASDSGVRSEGGDGARLGRYQLCFEVAQGGMGSVYLALASGGADKLIALKTIHPHLATERAFVEMFLDEARIASRITHANVASVFDAGEVDGRYFIAMEYLLGEPLSRVLKVAHASKDPRLLDELPRVVVRIVSDLCEGLHAAHELRDDRNELLQVVHRDISPHNLFVTYDGVAKVVDFGVARARNRLHQTSSGQVKGKHSYMAPEVLAGGEFDRRVDIWAMGVVLHQALTGRALFRRKAEAETLFAVMSAEIPRPSDVNPRVPVALDDVVLKALQRDPADRYATARALGRDLIRAYGAPVSLGDVADFMERALPNERAKKQQLIDIARSPRGVSVPVVHAAGAADTPASAPPTLAPAAVPPPAAPARRPRRAPLLVGVAVSIAFLAGVVVVLGLWSSTPRVPPTRVASPKPAAPTAAPPITPLTEAPLEPVAEAPVAPVAPPPSAPSEASTGGRSADGRGRATEARTGDVQIATPGTWASIHFRGRNLGQTPARVTLPAGRQVLTLRMRGTEARRVSVRVVPGRTTPLVVDR
ncbi:MAG: serine/threonine-protein kinase [Sandaracinaceae bacterium]